MAKYRQDVSRETFEQIENYLLDRMDGQTRLQFELSMAENAELAAEVALQQKLFAVVEAGSFSEKEPNRLSVRLNKNYTLRYAAAAMLLLIGAASLFFLQRSTSNNTTDLYAAYFQPDAGLPIEMGAADSSRYLFYDGMITYKEGNYAAALAQWKKLTPGEVQTDTLQYYMGMAYLNNGDYDASISVLKSLGSKPDAAFYQQANWYLALVFLKKGDKPAAIATLNLISKYPGASELLNKLREH